MNEQYRIDRKSVGPLKPEGNIRFHIYTISEINDLGVVARNVMSSSNSSFILIPWHDINWMEWNDSLWKDTEQEDTRVQLDAPGKFGITTQVVPETNKLSPFMFNNWYIGPVREDDDISKNVIGFKLVHAVCGWESNIQDHNRAVSDFVRWIQNHMTVDHRM